MVNKNEVVSKSEAARRWGVSSAAVHKYIGKGLIVRPDGKLDWPAADEWRRTFNAPQRSGSFRARQRANQGAQTKTLGMVGEDSNFTTGYALARANIRKAVPALIASMRPEGVGDRIATLAVIDHLLGAWLESSSAMPDIDWTSFTVGITPEGARDLFEELQEDFANVNAAGE